MEFLVTKNGNSWELLLTVFTESFVLHVTGLLNPTLKCWDKFRLRQESIPSVQSQQKNTRATCQIYSKSTIKTPERCLVFLWKYFALYSTVIIAEFEQINAGWGWETIVSHNKFAFSICRKSIVLWVGKICWATYFHPYSPNIRLQKDKFWWQYFQKISWTLKFIFDI